MHYWKRPVQWPLAASFDCLLSYSIVRLRKQSINELTGPQHVTINTLLVSSLLSLLLSISLISMLVSLWWFSIDVNVSKFGALCQRPSVNWLINQRLVGVGLQRSLVSAVYSIVIPRDPLRTLWDSFWLVGFLLHSNLVWYQILLLFLVN